MLYRLSACQEPALPALANDLALHLRYAPIHTLLVQIGNRQQAYISSIGCVGCLQKRCEASCQMQLLRRMLVANRVATEIQIVPHGLMQRPYTRVACALPGKHARALDTMLLTPWREARLWAAWRTMFGQQVVGVALAVHGAGPSPGDVLREYGWHGCTFPAPIAAYATRPQPRMLPFGAIWRGLPFMLLPELPQQAERLQLEHPIALAAASLPAEQIVLAGRKLTNLIAAYADATEHAHVGVKVANTDAIGRPAAAIGQASVDCIPANSHRIDSIPAKTHHCRTDAADWRLSDSRLMAIVSILVASELAQSGLGIQRIRRVADLTRGEAAILLCWLNLAGLLETPCNALNPWREPRRLISADPTTIIAQLQATPMPTAADLAIAFPKASAAALPNTDGRSSSS
jgi:hypothetical protein